VPDPVAKADGAPDMSIPGIAAMDWPLPDGAPDWGIGMVMPGIAVGAWSDGVPAAGDDWVGACGLDMSIPGIDCGMGDVDGGEVGAGVAISISGMASVRTGFGAGAAVPPRFPVTPRLGLGLAFGLGFAAGLAGIFMPGIGMPAMLWPAAMPGSIATAAAAASHFILIIGKSPWNK
jgi:hypothetical protein